MGKKILFSPVGGTDPIRYLRDGSLLHICRHYRPDIVYLYLSHEMMQIHRQDNRYVATIELLGKHLHHNFEVHVIERDALIDVQQYDIFYQDFRQEIRKIEESMGEEDELLLNMASGTPAMKSALMVMATLAEYRFLPIQVSTPQKRMNSEYEERKNYEIDVNWELDEDNQEEAPNRCTEVKCLHLMTLLKIEIIKKHLAAYDYRAALAVAEEIRRDIPADAYRMLQIADARVKLSRNKIHAWMREKEYDIYPIQESGKQKIFEYALVLQIKLKREEYADFIRGITPIVVDLLENILKNQCNIVLADYCKSDKDKILKWDEKKLQRSGLKKLLDEEYQGGFRCGPVYSGHLACLIRRKCSDRVLRQKVEDIVYAESRARNMAAHEIVSVTDEWFREKTGKSAKETFSLIQYLTRKAGINVKDEDWESYDRMNEQIIFYCQ